MTLQSKCGGNLRISCGVVLQFEDQLPCHDSKDSDDDIPLSKLAKENDLNDVNNTIPIFLFPALENILIMTLLIWIFLMMH